MLQIEKMLGGARRQSGGVLAEGEQDQEMSPQEQDTRGGSNGGKGQRVLGGPSAQASGMMRGGCVFHGASSFRL